MSRKVILYICCTLDGYIATHDDDISWLSIVEKEGEDYGYAEFTKGIDTYIVGRKSYDKVKQMVGHFPPAKQFDCYVLTRTEKVSEDGVTFYTGSLNELIARLKNLPGQNIYCDGGAEIVTLFLKENLLDELIIFICPILLGGGKRLFKEGIPQNKLKFIDSKTYETGMVRVRYEL